MPLPRHLLLLVFLSPLHAADFHIAASGKDSNPGTRSAPLLTLAAARTTALSAGKFNAASLRARPGQTLGTFRWIVWTTIPVTPAGENTAFQELAIDPAR